MRLRWWWLILLILLAQVPLWFSLGDHPIHGRSEGRYAVVAKHMVDSGNWLVPELDGHPHLTKPPLAYWSMAASMTALGTNEFAARLPSAMAGSLTLLLVLAVGWRQNGRTVGLASAALLCMFPLFFTVSRLALTDSLLSFAWTGVLTCGYFSVVGRTKQRRGWAVIGVWAFVAMGWMIKGPLALLPIAVLIVWLSLAKNREAIRRLHLLPGMLVTLVPAAVWARAIVELHPDAVSLWLEQSLGRVVNGNDHPEPFWYFLPVFLGGLFPATAMMLLPGINHRWSAMVQTLRRGNGTALWIVAIVLPLIVFSISSGKLATYILPLCPPMALLAGHVVVRWLRGVYERQHAIRGPLVPLPYYIALLSGVVASGVIIYLHIEVGMIPLVSVACVAVAVGIAVWHAWRSNPSWRPTCAFLVVVVWCMAIGVAFEVEDTVTNWQSVPKLYEHMRELTPGHEPSVYVAGIGNTSLEFYMPDVHHVGRPKDLLASMSTADVYAIAVLKLDQWHKLAEHDELFKNSFVPAMYWSDGFGSDEWVVLRRIMPRVAGLSLTPHAN
jgi:4-amino-4-deoxy-L-arabinose transferase-like glycosyltransferase